MTNSEEGRGLEAVVFDFDGLIVDSETPIYEASAEVLRRMGHELTIEGWATLIGLGHDDSFRALCAAVGAEVDREVFEAGYESQDRAWHDQLPALPGVVELLEALAEEAIPAAVASSSSVGWVEGHLERLGIRHRFNAVAGRDRVGGRSKPAPDAYLLACADLGVMPSAAVAIEDSRPGVAAAQAAGLRVIAVPSHITSHTDLSAADHTVASVAEISVALLHDVRSGGPPQDH